MPLTNEDIKGQSQLQGLTDEQVQAIVTLSANNQKAAIASVTADFWNRLDADIKEILGEEKPREVKSFDHLKAVLSQAKDKAGSTGELSEKIKALESEKAELQQQVKDGKGNEALKSQLAQLETKLGDKDSELKALRKQVQDKEAEYEEKLKTEQGKLDEHLFRQHFDSGLEGVKFNDAVPENVRKQYIESAKERILGTYKRDWIEEDGKRIPVFRDENGQIVANPNNLQKPFAPHELLQKEISDILVSEGQNGTGTKPAKGNSNYIGNPTTKKEAQELIRQSLTSQGLAVDSAEYAEKELEMYQSMEVDKLPLQ